MKVTIHEYTTFIEYYCNEFDYYLVIDKEVIKNKSNIRASDCRSDINIEFAKECLIDFDTNAYEYGKFLD